MPFVNHLGETVEAPEFDTLAIESLDDHFRVLHLSGNIFEWKLDLDSPRSGTNAR